MYSIVILAIFVLGYPMLRSTPDGHAARFLRRGLPIILLLVAAYFLKEKFEYGYVPTLERLNPLAALSLIQGYAALWLVHIVTSVTWVLSDQNQSAWVRFPWQKGSSKLMGLIWNGFLCVPLIPLLLMHMVVIGLVVWGYSRLKSRRKLKRQG